MAYVGERGVVEKTERGNEIWFPRLEAPLTLLRAIDLWFRAT
jgi:hypothetical protein